MRERSLTHRIQQRPAIARAGRDLNATFTVAMPRCSKGELATADGEGSLSTSLVSRTGRGVTLDQAALGPGAREQTGGVPR